MIGAGEGEIDVRERVGVVPRDPVAGFLVRGLRGFEGGVGVARLALDLGAVTRRTLLGLHAHVLGAGERGLVVHLRRFGFELVVRVSVGRFELVGLGAEGRDFGGELRIERFGTLTELGDGRLGLLGRRRDELVDVGDFRGRLLRHGARLGAQGLDLLDGAVLGELRGLDHPGDLGLATLLDGLVGREHPVVLRERVRPVALGLGAHALDLGLPFGDGSAQEALLALELRVGFDAARLDPGLHLVEARVVYRFGLGGVGVARVARDEPVLEVRVRAGEGFGVVRVRADLHRLGEGALVLDLGGVLTRLGDPLLGELELGSLGDIVRTRVRALRLRGIDRDVRERRLALGGELGVLARGAEVVLRADGRGLAATGQTGGEHERERRKYGHDAARPGFVAGVGGHGVVLDALGFPGWRDTSAPMSGSSAP